MSAIDLLHVSSTHDISPRVARLMILHAPTGALFIDLKDAWPTDASAHNITNMLRAVAQLGKTLAAGPPVRMSLDASVFSESNPHEQPKQALVTRLLTHEQVLAAVFYSHDCARVDAEVCV